MTVMACRILLRNKLDHLTPAEKRVAENIIGSPEETVTMPIGEMARRSAVSEASVVRLCQTLGYRGYNQLRTALSADLALGHGKTRRTVVHPREDPIGSLIAGNYGAAVEALKKGMEILDGNELRKAAEAIAEARRVDFYGGNGSGAVTGYGCSQALSMGKVSIETADPYQRLLSAASLNKEDMAVIVGSPEADGDLSDVLSIIRGTGAAVINIAPLGLGSDCKTDIRLSTACGTVCDCYNPGTLLEPIMLIHTLFAAAACLFHTQEDAGVSVPL